MRLEGAVGVNLYVSLRLVRVMNGVHFGLSFGVVFRVISLTDYGEMGLKGEHFWGYRRLVVVVVCALSVVVVDVR